MTAGRLLGAVPSAAGAAVMGTSIVSIALARDGRGGLSLALMWVAIVLWLGLAVAYLARAVGEPGRLRAEAMEPAALTSAADSCVLGSRLTEQGWRWAGCGLLVLGVLAWAPLTANVIRHRQPHPDGAGFLLTVATEAVAVLALALGTAWLVVPAAVLISLGVGLYVLVLRRFEPRELLRDAGDHWVAGGALAIAALALADLARSPHAGALHGVASAAALAVWVAAVAWLPALLACEVARPRPHYDVRRWATVFPLGMYSVSSDALDAVRGGGAIAAFGHVMTWVALAAWFVTFAGMCVRSATLVRAMT